MGTNNNRRRVLCASAPLAVLLLSAAPAAASVQGGQYPPVVPPGETLSDTAVLGSRADAPASGGTSVLGTKTESSQLALTGTDALPYLAGGLVLVAGGAGLFLVARRKEPLAPAV